jgi:hypothetical protein
VGEVAVVAAAVARGAVAAELPGDRRWRPAEATGDLLHAVTAFVQRGDPLPFELREIATAVLVLPEARWR